MEAHEQVTVFEFAQKLANLSAHGPQL